MSWVLKWLTSLSCNSLPLPCDVKYCLCRTQQHAALPSPFSLQARNLRVLDSPRFPWPVSPVDSTSHSSSLSSLSSTNTLFSLNHFLPISTATLIFRNKSSLFNTKILSSRENFLFFVWQYSIIFYYKLLVLKVCTYLDVLLCLIIKCHTFND